MRVMRIILMVAVLLLVGASPVTVAQATVAQRLVGAWELVTYEIIAAMGRSGRAPTIAGRSATTPRAGCLRT